MDSIVLTRSNAVRADDTVRDVAWDRDSHAEARAVLSTETAPFRYAHVVLGIRVAVPKRLREQPGLHFSDRDLDGTTWVGGTLASWLDVLRAEMAAATPNATLLACAGEIARHTDFPVFGLYGRVIAAGQAMVRWPSPDDAMTAARAQVSGGLVAISVSRAQEEALAAGGVAVVDAVGARTRTRWLPSTALSGPALVLPFDRHDLPIAARRALERYEASYTALMAALPASAQTPLASPCEARWVLAVIDGQTLDAFTVDTCLAPLRERLSAALAPESATETTGATEADASAGPAPVAPVDAAPARARVTRPTRRATFETAVPVAAGQGD